MVKENNINYSDLKSELDGILLRLQDENIDIDESIQLYERGLELVKELEQYLKTAENKVTKIKAKFNISEK